MPPKGPPKPKKVPKVKINEEKLMQLMDTHKVLEISNSQHRGKVWEKITNQYNSSNNTAFTNEQVIAKYKYYKKTLRDVKSAHTKSVKRTGTFFIYLFNALILVVLPNSHDFLTQLCS